MILKPHWLTIKPIIDALTHQTTKNSNMAMDCIGFDEDTNDQYKDKVIGMWLNYVSLLVLYDTRKHNELFT